MQPIGPITDRTLLFHRLAHAWVLLAMALQLPDADVLWTQSGRSFRARGHLGGGSAGPYHFLPAGSVYLGNGLLAMLAVGGCSPVQSGGAARSFGGCSWLG